MEKSLMHFFYLQWQKVFFCLVFSSLAIVVHAQKTITGKIIDATTSNPISGISVQAKGTTSGGVTDETGNFSVRVPSKATAVVISGVGYASQTVSIVGRADIGTISLQATASELDQVVVVGYGSQRKKDLTGAVDVVNMGEMKKQPTPSVEEGLQGRAAGITVIGTGQPGTAPQIRIRGFNTFGNNTPLYVVDGAQTQDLTTLNPNDVESLQVLKDAGAASIYGSRASNGVLIITTKKGKGKTTVSYDMYIGTQIPKNNNVFHLLNPQDQAQLEFNADMNTQDSLSTGDKALYGNGTTPVLPDYLVAGGGSTFSVGQAITPAMVDPSLYKVDPNYTSVTDYNNFYRITPANKAGTDWNKEITRTAPIQSHNISVGYGGENGSAFFSMNYFNQQGTVRGTYYKRYSLRSNATYNVSSRVRLGENLAYTIAQNPTTGGGGILTEGSYIGMAYREQTIIPVFDIAGNYAGGFGGDLGNAVNPVAQIYRDRNNTDVNDRLLGNVWAEADILKELTLRTSFGGAYYNNNSSYFSYPQYNDQENSTTNTYGEYYGSGYNWTWTSTATYHHRFGESDLKVLVGQEANLQYDKYINASKTGYFSFDPNYTTLSTGSANTLAGSGRTKSTLNSYFARADYSYKDRYLLEFTVRRDGSSKFMNYQWGTFPAVSAGWRISQENFMKSLTWISELKIRGSWGIMGNQLNVNPYNSYTAYGQDMSTSYYSISGITPNIVQGFYQATLGNPNAKWEQDKNLNIGFDASILKGLFDISFDYYAKNISNLLYNPGLPGTQGNEAPPFINVAKMNNHGFDLGIGNTTKLTKDLTLDVTATITTYKNTIQKISDGSTNFFDYNYGSTRIGSVIINQVGSPMSSFYGYKVVGFFNSQADIDAADAQARTATGNPNAIYETDEGIGRFKYAYDPNANVTGSSTLITPDSRKILGSPNPDFSYGLNVGLTYKSFDFSAFFYGLHGAQVWNQIKWWDDFVSSFTGAKSYTALYDSWTPTHQNAKAPIQENNSYFSTANVPNSYYVDPGSYFRLKNVQLGYTLPEKTTQHISIQKLRVYIQAANLFTITKYPGVDPEITGGTTGFGKDEGSYANPRQFLFGLNVTF
ncbi:MAG: SusC/RagA family TonB-linked outer membrane protein [Chitinophagaceae bacterium]|jgi:TonB-linked SusC/RagA family outer membrane protein|nr:SusC/RagA family TonB-linked outer membrane protein [Chitinophagaceae bacterium]